MKLSSAISCNFYHIIIREECFVRDAVPTFVLASVNVTSRLQHMLHEKNNKINVINRPQCQLINKCITNNAHRSRFNNIKLFTQIY